VVLEGAASELPIAISSPLGTVAREAESVAPPSTEPAGRSIKTAIPITKVNRALFVARLIFAMVTGRNRRVILNFETGFSLEGWVRVDPRV